MWKERLDRMHERIAPHELNHASRSRSQLEISYHGSMNGTIRPAGRAPRSISRFEITRMRLMHAAGGGAQRDAQQSVVELDRSLASLNQQHAGPGQARPASIIAAQSINGADRAHGHRAS